MLNYHEKILRKERAFHDQWASKIDIEKIDVQKYFEGSTSPENRFILSHMGIIKDKSILDLGCGAGENSVYFALKGARCIATDYSSLMVKTALQLAKKCGVTIEGRVMNAMEIEYPDSIRNVLSIIENNESIKTRDLSGKSKIATNPIYLRNMVLGEIHLNSSRFF